MKTLLMKIIDMISEDRLNEFFKNKIRAFLFWYILAFFVGIFVGGINFGRGGILLFFPFKLFPFLFAKNAGEYINKRANNIFFSPESFVHDIKNIIIISAICAVSCVVLYVFTGLDILWLVI